MNNQTKNKELKAPKNLRQITPRCCGTCKYGYFANGAINCERVEGENGLQWVAGAEDHYMYVCDYYKQGE